MANNPQTSTRMKHFFSFLLILLLLEACHGKGGNRQEASQDKPTITVTIEPLRFFVECVAGDRFHVVSIVPKGSSPETYDPTPQQLMDLTRSTAYFRIGYLGFEQVWLDRLAENAPHLSFFNLSDGIDLIYDDTHNHHVALDGQEAETGVEPHVWSSTANAQIISANILKALHVLDAAHDSLYFVRYRALCSRIERTDSLIRSTLQAPGADTAFMIYHPALSYFARDYGLHQISIEEGGKEPSPTHLQGLMDICRKENVHVVFVQPEFDRRNAELIARQTGAEVVDINPLAYDWEGEMLRVARALRQPGSAS